MYLTNRKKGWWGWRGGWKGTEREKCLCKISFGTCHIIYCEISDMFKYGTQPSLLLLRLSMMMDDVQRDSSLAGADHDTGQGEGHNTGHGTERNMLLSCCRITDLSLGKNLGILCIKGSANLKHVHCLETCYKNTGSAHQLPSQCVESLLTTLHRPAGTH